MLFKNRLWHTGFPLNFAKLLRTIFIKEHLWWLLLYIIKNIFIQKLFSTNFRGAAPRHHEKSSKPLGNMAEPSQNSTKPKPKLTQTTETWIYLSPFLNVYTQVREKSFFTLSNWNKKEKYRNYSTTNSYIVQEYIYIYIYIYIFLKDCWITYSDI